MIPSWFTRQEVYFVITLLMALSLSREFRVWVTRPFQEAKMQELREELASLVYMHDNAYGLLLYLARNILDILGIIAVLGLVVFAVDMLLVRTGQGGLNMSPFEFMFGCGALIGGRVLYMASKIRKLCRFDERSAEIKQKLAKLDVPMASPPA